MTLHKLLNEPTPTAASIGVRVSLNHELCDLGEAIVRTRAVQAFEHAGRLYPIHRVVRCAIQRKLAPLFDDLALHMGCAAQRVEVGSLLLDAPGVFVSAQGYNKGEYVSCWFGVWTDTLARFEEIRQRLLRVAGDQRLRDRMFTVDWNFCNSRGVLLSTSFDELADEILLDEAYPSLGVPVASFVDGYLGARETVLILQGPPGMGKTRLVRAVLGAMSSRKGDSAKVMYTADKRALQNDEIFVDFITGSHDAFVIEDADHLLKARTSGNFELHRFLGVRRRRGARAKPQVDLHHQPAEHQRHRRRVAAARPMLCGENAAQPRARRSAAAGGEDLRGRCRTRGESASGVECGDVEVLLGGAGVPRLRAMRSVPVS